ncbi:phage head spike fiber domain-containing protein [Leclercia adecarboxylata]|uniref:phage head spike fiber domain-containing protein n=1 Tax=Leclercia adecarboxylata TaxID=83655 RepID=UPI00254D53F3|nr:hypothetical protein [Leclercia adecarboxylata]
MATLDDDLANAVTEGFRLAQSSIINQDLILSGTGDVTVTLANGSKKTGPSWSKLITAANAAGTSATAAKTSETNALASKNAAATSATNAATSEGNALASKNAAKTSETNAKTSETNSKTSENNAAASAISAAASLAAAQQLTSVPYEAAPFPDVWAPLNDDLRLLAGFAPFDTLTISGKVLELPLKSLSFARASTATYIDKSGGLQTAAINEPRFERDGLLMEGTATNLALNSADFGNAYWPKARVTTTPGFTAPDNSANAVKLIPTAEEASSHYISKPFNVTAGNAHGWSIFVKAGEYTKCRLNFSGSAVTNNMSCDFDLIAGTATGVTSDGIPTITALGDGWYRISARTETIAANGTVNANIWVMDQNTTTFTGDGVKGIYIWGAQFEIVHTTSYIPTVASAVTRAGESLTIQAACNVGYKIVGDSFNRTLAFEISVDSFSPIGAGYFNVLNTAGVSYDVALRAVSTSLNSLRSSSGILPTINVTYPFYKQIFVQTIDTANKLTAYFGGQAGTRTGPPPTPAGSPTSLVFATTNSLVYHIRNFRIWHRLLTANQIKGLR